MKFLYKLWNHPASIHNHSRFSLLNMPCSERLTLSQSVVAMNVLRGCELAKLQLRGVFDSPCNPAHICVSYTCICGLHVQGVFMCTPLHPLAMHILTFQFSESQPESTNVRFLKRNVVKSQPFVSG